MEKVRTLTSSQDLNKLIIENLSKVNMVTFTSRSLVNSFQKYSDHFKFDQSLKMTEIKSFAKEVIPESRFIFDRYKVDGETSSKKADSDYFSYFNSHEDTLLRPENEFKNLHELMTYLPVDYYILLQRGFDNKSKNTGKPKRTNQVMFTGLPVLQEIKTSYQTKRVTRAITYEEVQRQNQRAKAISMLNDPLAETELTNLLQKYFDAKVTQLRYINFNAQAKCHMIMNNEILSHNHLDEFEDII